MASKRSITYETLMEAASADPSLLPKLRELQAQLDTLNTALKSKPAVGYIPNAAQDRFHRAKARGRAFFAGNRTGKTTACVLEAYAHALGVRPWLPSDDPDHVVTGVQVPSVGRLYVPDYKAWDRDVYNEWIKWIPSREYRFHKSSQQVTTKITFVNGSVIFIMTREMDDMAHEGGKIDWVAYNEPPKFAHFKSAQRGLMDTNGPWFMCCTLLEDEPWVFEQIWERSGDDPNLIVLEGSSEDNLIEKGGVLHREALDELAKFLTPEERAARLDGKPLQAAGRIFKAYQSKAPWLIDPIPLEPTWPIFCAIDPHPAKPDAVLWGAVDPQASKLYIISELYETYITTNTQLADAIKRRENKDEFWFTDPYLGKKMRTLGAPRIRWIDPAATILEKSHGRNRQQALVDLGIYTTTWSRANQATRISIAKDWLALREGSTTPTVQIFKNCSRLDWELRHWFWDSKTGKPGSKHDDLIDCLLAFANADVIRMGKSTLSGVDLQKKTSTNTSWGPVKKLKTSKPLPKSSTGY